MANITKALSGSTDAAGGFVVPETLAREVLSYVTSKVVAMDDCQQVAMPSDEMRLPKLTSGHTARLGVAQSGTITGSDVGFGRTTLSAQKFAALTTASTELLEDAPIAVAGLIREDMGRQIALAIDNAILGTSTAQFATPMGNTGSTANTMSSGTLTWLGLNSASNLILKANHGQPDRMYINPVNILKLQNATGSDARPIFNQETWGSPLLREGVIGTVLGMQVKPTTQLTSSSIILAKSGLFGYFGNRRAVTVNKAYQVATDDIVFNSTVRVAFALKYSDAYALMTNVA